MTDGRFSGANNGCFAVRVSPEATEGGPKHPVKDGDVIMVDIPGRRIHLHGSDDEIEARLSMWQRLKPKFRKGYSALYVHLRSLPTRARLSGKVRVKG